MVEVRFLQQAQRIGIDGAFVLLSSAAGAEAEGRAADGKQKRHDRSMFFHGKKDSREMNWTEESGPRFELTV